jgi:hypothetical protein
MQKAKSDDKNRFPASASHLSYLFANKKTHDQTCNFVNLMTKIWPPTTGHQPLPPPLAHDIPKYAESEICPRKSNPPPSAFPLSPKSPKHAFPEICPRKIAIALLTPHNL